MIYGYIEADAREQQEKAIKNIASNATIVDDAQCTFDELLDKCKKGDTIMILDAADVVGNDDEQARCYKKAIEKGVALFLNLMYVTSDNKDAITITADFVEKEM